MMKFRLFAAVCCLAILSPNGHCSNRPAIEPGDRVAEGLPGAPGAKVAFEPLPFLSSGESSSRESMPDAPSALGAESRVSRGWGPSTHLALRTTPFSSVALGMSVGSGGLGVELATPLATKLNLRVGMSFLNYNPVLVEQGIPVDGTVKFRTLSAGVEYFPYRNSFHITPGLTMYNGNHVYAVTNIAAGQHFTIDDTDYVSDPSNPVHGYFDMTFGKQVAPSLTIGFGNMLQNHGGHWSIPVDVGFEYIGQPKFVLNMQGGVCTPTNGCDAIASDTGATANLAQQQKDVNDAISPLRFYPIFKTGVAYRFGGTHARSNWR